MFMLKTIFGKAWSDTNTNELAKLPSGELYIVRPNSSVKGVRECLYQDAMATVRRTNQEFNYQLVITRVYEQGEEEILDEDDETDNERVFLIDTALDFRTGTFEGRPTLVFRDLDGDEDDLFEFVATTNEPTLAYFAGFVLRAIYERKYQKSADKVKDSELAALLWKPPKNASGSRPGPGPTTARTTAINALSNQMANSHLAPTTSSHQNAAVLAPSPAPPVEEYTEEEHRFGKKLLSEEAELLRFDYDEDAFVVQCMVDITIVQSLQGRFNFYIVAEDDGFKLLAHELTPHLNNKWSKKYLSYRWIYRPPNMDLSAWCVRFASEEGYERFKEAANRCLWEMSNGMSWEEAKKEDTQYAIDTYRDQDVEMLDVEGLEEEEEDEVAEGLIEESSEEEDEDEEPRGIRAGKAKAQNQDADDSDAESVNEAEREFYSKASEHNTAMVVGHKRDRTYVVRGGRIGVFDHAEPGEVGVRHAGTLNKVMTPKGKAFSPKKVMLHDQDGAMLLLNPADPHSLYKMDLTVGKVVEEWKVHDDVPLAHITPDSKFAQETARQTLIGASTKGLFRIDPRVSGNKLVDGEFKQYVTKAAFSGLATTEAGHLAVASEKGDIRLFDSIGKNAKTALPALGDPIIGVDVTASGRWIVATCQTHIYVIDTLINEGRYKDKLGFERSFPANARPTPKRLQLKPEHVVYMGTEPSFTPARFNIGPDQDETTIITSSGHYIIAWDFKKVKQGILDSYEIRKYEDAVVQDDFQFANDNNIVVALKNNVLMAKKQDLKRPTRKSLGGSSRQLRSRAIESEQIVNTGGY